jgi:hypothetical protein
MATASYQKIPTPGYTSPTHTFTDDEILASSTGRFTQWGITIAGGQGILPAGCVMGRKTADKKYYVYNNSGSGGIDTARGVLRRAVDTGPAGSPDQQGNIVISGIIKLSKVSGADSAALTDLGATVDSVLDTFRM